MLSHSPQETQQFAQIITPYLQNGGVLCLYGDLGSGKTLLTKAILSQFGIAEKNVKSPTYTLIKEHISSTGLKIYHADFYRMEELDELTHHHIEEIFHKPNRLVVIEWAERVARLLPIPRIEVTLEYKGEHERLITPRYFFKPLPDADIEELYKEFHVPHHIRRHMAKVAEVGVSLADAINKHHPQTVNTLLVQQAALLHDIVKVCDIPEERLLLDDVKLDDVKLKYAQSGEWDREDRQCWRSLRQQYGAIGHAQAASQILLMKNEPMLGIIIAKHVYTSLIDSNPANRLQTWEEKLVYYADKRVKHDQIVSLQERLRDGRERYFPDGNLPPHEADVEKALVELEQEIYAAAGIKELPL